MRSRCVLSPFPLFRFTRQRSIRLTTTLCTTICRLSERPRLRLPRLFTSRGSTRASRATRDTASTPRSDTRGGEEEEVTAEGSDSGVERSERFVSVSSPVQPWAG